MQPLASGTPKSCARHVSGWIAFVKKSAKSKASWISQCLLFGSFGIANEVCARFFLSGQMGLQLRDDFRNAIHELISPDFSPTRSRSCHCSSGAHESGTLYF